MEIGLSEDLINRLDNVILILKISGWELDITNRYSSTYKTVRYFLENKDRIGNNIFILEIQFTKYIGGKEKCYCACLAHTINKTAIFDTYEEGMSKVESWIF